jgi:hypothetical protein
MKVNTIVGAAVIAICGALSAQPATSVDRVNVHFSTPVEVGSVTIPAGDCSIEVLRGEIDDRVLEFRPQSGPAVFILTDRVNEPVGEGYTAGSTQVVLVRHGGDYRFERLLMPNHTGFEVVRPVE